MSRFRPNAPVIVVTPDDQLIRHCRSVYGQIGMYLDDIEDENVMNIVDKAAAFARGMVRLNCPGSYLV